jgi:SNF2 family DNA or RNA helicase
MAKRNYQKRKTKRKIKQKVQRSRQSTALRLQKGEYFFHEATFQSDQENYDKSLQYLRKALKVDPENIRYIHQLVFLGNQMDKPKIEIEGLSGLYNLDELEDRFLPRFIDLLTAETQYKLAMEVTDLLLERLSKMKIADKRKIRASAKRNREYCEYQYRMQDYVTRSQVQSKKIASIPRTSTQEKKVEKPEKNTFNKSSNTSSEPAVSESSSPAIPVNIYIDKASFKSSLLAAKTSTYQRYEVALEALNIRFMDSFENLICLSNLKDVQSFWYQEETARKVLKTFRGRALLSDEVGLGKTIEASMVLKEYIQRGMAKSALILTPTPLVSQWKEELKSKFDLDFSSTDDPGFRKNGPALWSRPFILASINIAKSKRNFETVTGREYDMVIVDEAHHLKNRNTLNWKLVNGLKKRFLLLLTATPVENNLMELYNLITLLKPGQLKTASAFREEFMTKGDPTSPQNRARLKELLGQVMIRNTRALAKINIPPRFAETVRIDPNSSEKELYEKICRVAVDINQSNGGGNKMLLKNLLATAGSSPRALELTIDRMLAKKRLESNYRKEFHAIRKLAGLIGDTRKNKIMLKLIRSATGKKIIFVNYLGTLEQISSFFTKENISHAVFCGQMSNYEKDEQIQNFKETKDLLVTTEIGGEGRNLQFCHQMINYDLPWNPMRIEQRIGRIHRIGQQNEVRIYNLCAAGSIEDYILDILDRKINMFEMVIGEIDMVLGRIKGEKDFSDRIYHIWIESLSSEDRKKGFTKLAAQLKRFKTQYETTKTLDEKLFGESYEL